MKICYIILTLGYYWRTEKNILITQINHCDTQVLLRMGDQKHKKNRVITNRLKIEEVLKK